MLPRSVRAFFFFLVFSPLPAAAQPSLPIGIDARVGLAMPVGDFADTEEGFTSEEGPSFAIGGSVYPLASVGVFAAYHRTHFGCEQCPILGLDETAVLQGLEAGVHLAVPLGDFSFTPWVRPGFIQQTLTFSGFDDRMSSDAAFGFTAAAGVTIPLMPSLELNPAIRYYAITADFDFSSLPDRSVDVSALSVDFGLSFRP